MQKYQPFKFDRDFSNGEDIKPKANDGKLFLKPIEEVIIEKREEKLATKLKIAPVNKMEPPPPEEAKFQWGVIAHHMQPIELKPLLEVKAIAGVKGEDGLLENQDSLQDKEGENLEGGEEKIEEPPMMFTVEELIFAKDEGYAEGYNKGLKEGQEQAQSTDIAIYNELLERISSEMLNLNKNLNLGLGDFNEGAVRILNIILQKTIPNILKQGGAEEIQAIYVDSLNRLKDIVKLNINYNPSHDEKLRPILMKIAEMKNLQNNVQINLIETIKPGDVEMDWGDGGIARHIDKIIADIQKTLEHISAKENNKTEPSIE